MLKKIFSFIIATVMSVSVLTGCKLVTLDTEYEEKKEVLTIASYTISGYDKDGKPAEYETEPYTIYKGEFQSVYDSYALMYEQYYGMSHDDVIDELLRSLAVERIVLNLANAYIEFGYFDLGTYENNVINQNVYSAINQLIDSYEVEILEENGKIVVEEEEEEESNTATTYPIQAVDTDAYARYTREQLVDLCIERGLLNAPVSDAAQDKIDAYTVVQLKNLLVKFDRNNADVWTPSLASYPGLFEHDMDARSLRLEAFSRALAEMKRQALELYTITDEDKALIEKDYENFTKITNEQGLSYVYGELADSHVVKLLVRDGYVNEQKMALLEEYIVGTVEVTKAEVEKEYNTRLNDQKIAYANESTYSSAINNEDVLYFPNDNYFFVKHILLPFSTAQSTALTNYKSSIENTLYGDYYDYRDRLANEIMVYEHVDGEDFGDPIAISNVYNEIVNAVNGQNTIRDKERTFTDLIYKYNTDPGIFDSTYGYVELYDLGSNTESYVQEFADAARALYEGGVEGALSEMVVTDYGVHILYLSKMPKAGEVLGLYDYVTYSEEQTVYSVIESSLITLKEEEVFANWRTNQVSRYYEDDEIVLVEWDELKDLGKDHDHSNDNTSSGDHDDHEGHNH